MSKKRKTRKEKIRTQIRQSSQAHDASPVYSIDAMTPASPARTIHDSPVHTGFTKTQYAYVLHDARQTFIITSIIFAASVVFYLILQNHILNLNFLGY